MSLTSHAWGLSEYFRSQVLPEEENQTLCRIIAEERGLFRIASGGRQWWAETSGRLHHEALAREDLPAIGDWVLARTGAVDDRAHVLRILRRKSQLSRRDPSGHGMQILAANVDKVLIATSANQEWNPRRLERYLTLAWDSGAIPILVVTKCDLAKDQDAILREAQATLRHVDVHLVSSLSGEGLAIFPSILGADETGVLVGSSGVGKSTLLNALLGQDAQKTQMIRAEDAKGRHTTTSRSLLAMPHGAFLIDTPGLREVGLGSTEDALDKVFDDILALAEQCRFRDCGHGNEPGCAVQEAIREGSLAPERLASYHKLEREEAYERRRSDKAAQSLEKKRWATINKDLRRFYKNNKT